MRFSRHARNNMRLYRVTAAEVRRVLANPVETRQDGRGNPIVVTVIANRSIAIVVAADDPGYVITLFDTRP